MTTFVVARVEQYVSLMLPRRSFLLGAVSLGFAASACNKKPTRASTTATHAGVEFTLLTTPDHDDKMPLVVAMHGLGGSPEAWTKGFSSFPGRATIALPRGFEKHEKGFRWFPWNPDLKNGKLVTDVATAEQRLWHGVMALAAGRKVVVTGFSEGGILSYLMAIRHPEAVAGAFPVAAACPPAFFPADRVPVAKIVAYHGTADDVIPIQLDRDSIAALTRAGDDAKLREYAGLGHSASDELHDDLKADMQKLLG